MATVPEEHLLVQRSIERAVDNLKKLGRKNWTKATLRTRIAHIHEQWKKFDTSYAQLLHAIPSTERPKLSYFNTDNFAIVEETYMQAVTLMTSALDELLGEEKTSSASDRQSSLSPPDIHLPPINVPQFDGRFETWEAFRDKFTALVVNNKSLHNVTRLHYLNSALKGRALEGIGNLAITDANFGIAWEILKSRYENPRRLINAHLSALQAIPALARESAAELQNLRDQVTLTVDTLRKLGRKPEDLWNDLLVHFVSHKLDPSTRKAWQHHISDDVHPPSFDTLLRFIESRTRALEEFAPTSAHASSARTNEPNRAAAASSRVHTAITSRPHQGAQTVCPICKGAHSFGSCPKFTSKGPKDRRELAKQFSRCFNCLGNHVLRDCPSKYTCRVCRRHHHSLLHDESPSAPSTSPETSIPTPAPTIEARTHFVSALAASKSTVLLATAWIKISAPSGRNIIVRALIDPGSEVSFISASAASTLRANRIRVNTSISAVGGTHAGTVRQAVNLTIAHRESESPSVAITALILKSLSTYTPKRTSSLHDLDHLKYLNWADAEPTSSHPIQLLLGADTYSSIILEGLRKGARNQPIAQNTIFGWIISGPMTCQSSTPPHLVSTNCNPSSVATVSMHHCIETDPLSSELRRFWEIEEIPTTQPRTLDEEQCELHFQANTKRAADGHYIVRLPFRKDPPIEIGQSYFQADKVMNSVQRRLRAQPSVFTEYHDFIREYEALGHMRRVSLTDADPQCVYIPHHSVIRNDSSTTHLRVVFNASSRTSNGTCLNDHLLPGPKLQLDLSAIILRWRTFRYVYTADIAKMYRQIRVDERDVNYQRILWKDSPSDATQAFQLLTVTYGMNCAPFLALRVLQQLVDDEGSQHPLAVPILRRHTYVDDILFGGDNVSEIRQSRKQLLNLLHRGHMNLRKWASNSAEFLADIDPSDHGLACSKSLDSDDRVKILGLTWNPSTDTFQYIAKVADVLPATKRAILSAIAKLYDPLGWLTPATISAKILIQDLWRCQSGWDDPIPDKIMETWKRIYWSLSLLNGLQIRRWLGTSPSSSQIELHGFADASTTAYAAVVYARCKSDTGIITTSLLAGKSKVAPLKPLTVPRLELQATVLLGHLMSFIASSLDLQEAPCFCWTDSTVALAWLHAHPSKWKTFVANRVADVQTRLPHASWRHIPTLENPADCASRGINGDVLLKFSLWWQGPTWLADDPSTWPLQANHSTVEESSEPKSTLHVATVDSDWALSSRFSSWEKLIRVTAYVQRFVRLSRTKRDKRSPHAQERALTVAECATARLFWIRQIQKDSFPAEYAAIVTKKPLPRNKAIEALSPFVDDNGVIRVGGRLRNAPIPFSRKHPLLLAPHPLVQLIIKQIHLRSLHAGLQLTLHTLRQEYWVLRARSQVKAVIHACVKCTRERAAIPEQIMGNLPAARVTPPSKPFAHCGLDYAGPINIRASAGRGITSRKAYIALFVCLTTKAVHLELVADYSTAAFLNAYTRFCSRRGLPENMYSDNGTTFVGANRELCIAYRAATRNPDLLNRSASDGVTWHFIPPAAPHFGGLWEAGVKSVKHHLRRVLGDRMLTFEEFTTLLCAIEACLNSRPLAPLSDTLDDYESLTPGHFLTGAPLTLPPQPSLLDLAENRLSRWQLVRQMNERFWKLWQADYINTLQQRSKWRRIRPSLAVGQLVLLRNSALPPCKWELGRITELHSGNDNQTRVVTVRTTTGCFRRPIVKLCPLPVTCDQQP